MAIESITCPNCGASKIQIDTARDHSLCSFCSSTIKTKDVVYMDAESTKLDKLKSNAQQSFTLGQYRNAKKDWTQALEINRNDHTCYWGLVRCYMATTPDGHVSERPIVRFPAFTFP